MATELAFNFQDSWDVSNNVPNLASLTLNNTTDIAKYWVVTVAGDSWITDPGHTAPGPVHFSVGDGVAWNGTHWVKIPYNDVALSELFTDASDLKSKIFVVPEDFDWNNAANVSPLENTECIISHEHNIETKVNLPAAIQLRFLPGGKFKSAITDKMPSFNLTSGWTTQNSATIVNSNTFSVAGAAGADGIVRKTGVLQQDRSFTIRIKGTTTTNTTVRVYSGAGAIAFTPLLGGTFDITVTTLYTGTDSSIMLRAFNPGTVTIDNFEVLQGGFLDSPCDYGSTDEKSYPVIDNVSGFNFINGGILYGMFKARGNEIRMSDYFAGENYPVYFYDSFVRTKFVIDKTFTQTWYPRDPVNANQLITDALDKNFRGLSEGCGIQGTAGVTINNFAVYATGDFYIKGLTANTGRVNICSFYNRPLKVDIADCTFTNVGIDNIGAHPVVTSVMLETNIRDSSFLMNLPEPPVQMVFQFLSVINSRISNCRFSYPNYVPVTGKGQPIIILSSVNSIYENNVMDKGDSGLVFYLAGDSRTDYITFIESHAMDFKGFENNIIRGNTMYNMSEEAISFDSSDSPYPTVTINRNYFTVLSITDAATDSRIAAVQLNSPDSANYVTFINTIMTSITKGKFGKYCKIVKIERAVDDTDYTKFSITGSAGFFKGAVAGDKYSVTYGLLNNIIENNSFVNCMLPIALYMYSFHNIIRGNNVFGSYANNSAVAGCVRLLSYSARRKRCYIAPAIDNVIENNVFTGNGLLVLSAKVPTEWRNTWLNADPEPYDATITEEGDYNTIVRGNVLKNTGVKLQGLNGCVYENNQLVSSVTEITGTTFYSDMWNTVNESENIGIDKLFAQADMMGSTLVPLLSKGDGSGYIRLRISLSGDVTVRTTGNAFLYTDNTGTGKSRSKTLTGAIADIYVRCLSGDAQIIISNAQNITAFGNETDDFLLKYDTANSPDVYMLKVRYLPRTLTVLKQLSADYSINLRGNVSNLPEGLTVLMLDTLNSSLLDGYISDFPASLTKIRMRFPLTWSLTTALRGDLANLPPLCTYFYDETLSGIYAYSQRNWTTLNRLRMHLPSSNTWTADMVDQFLIDMAAATWVGEKSLYLKNTSASAPLKRTSASDAAVNILTVGTETQPRKLTVWDIPTV